MWSPREVMKNNSNQRWTTRIYHALARACTQKIQCALPFRVISRNGTRGIFAETLHGHLFSINTVSNLLYSKCFYYAFFIIIYKFPIFESFVTIMTPILEYIVLFQRYLIGSHRNAPYRHHLLTMSVYLTTNQ